MNEQTKPQAQPATAATQLAAPMPAKHSFKPLKECKNLEEAFSSHEFMERIQASVPQHVQPGRMLRTFVSAVTKMPLLAKADIRTFVGACLTASQCGLEPNTPLGHIWMLPFKTKIWDPATRRRDKEIVQINVIFGYPGLLDLSYRTTKVKGVHADVVWPGDEFTYEYGSNAHLMHRPRGHQEGDRPLFAYMHAQLDGGQAFEVMPYSDVLSIRNKAQAYRYALAAKEEAEAAGRRPPPAWSAAPWVAYETAMARKTAFRSGSKWLPRSVELASAIALDEAQDRRRSMDFGAVMDAPTIDGTPDYLGAAADAAMSEEEDERAADNRAVDPGAAFAQRSAADTSSNQTSDPPAARAAPAKEEPATPSEVKVTPPAKPALTQPPAQAQRVAKPVSAPNWGFEAMLVDEHGEILGEPILEVKAFAAAYAALYRRTSAEAREAIAEHNADAIEEAMADPAARSVLIAVAEEVAPAEPDEMLEQQARAGNVQSPIAAIEVPSERGRVSWASYLKAIRAALPEVATEDFTAWTSAQRETLARCPMAQRAMAVRVIAESAALRSLEQPAWLADLVRAKPVPTSEAKVEPQAAAVDDTPAQPIDSKPEVISDPDERWVNNRVLEIGALTDRNQFDLIVRSNAVRTMMARLRRDKPALFARADAAFSAKHQALPSADEGEL